MTEQAPFEPEPQPREDESEPTGVPSVDRVLTEVDALDQLPLDQHVSAFEQVHESLRAALDAQPDAQPETPPDTPPDAGPGAPA